jgi:hypothetical protein
MIEVSSNLFFFVLGLATGMFAMSIIFGVRTTVIHRIKYEIDEEDNSNQEDDDWWKYGQNPPWEK